ncbi:kinesin-like protein KIF23 [Galendromus occidentalis]|uniref:Kinesin-like protein KIF23 n=1 Tax=Galendromus occidentalis TaxID=34638 RepID=A0AAJ7SI73_9ACAR|nr:kinesin-like protein KIF23 [Galendromus occidentalis]
MDRYKVYLRLKPLSAGETDVSELQNDKTLIIHPGLYGKRAVRYSFRGVFEPTSSQQEVFRRLALPAIRNVLSGKPALIFVNGVEASGKTHTLIGTPEDAGILPRALDVLFNSIPPNLQAMKFAIKPDTFNGYEARLTEDAMIDRQNVLIESGSRIGIEDDTAEGRPSPEQSPWARRDRWKLDETKVAADIPDDCRIAVFVQFVEIRNNCVYDLLDETTHENRGHSWKNIRHDSSKSTYVSGANEIEVENADEAMDIYLRGESRKQIAQSESNAENFGSHTVFTIKIVQAPVSQKTGDLVLDKDFITVTQLHLVNLAGCVGNYTAKSLDYTSLCLRSCLNILRENQMEGGDKKIPYRDSRLTHLFKSFFEGIGGIKMLLCINPRVEDLAETLEVLKFAEIAEDIDCETPLRRTKKKIQFREPSPTPSIEEFYTTAWDMGSHLEPQDRVEDLNFDSCRIAETPQSTSEERTSDSRSSIDFLHEELHNALSQLAAQEKIYRDKSRAHQDTLLKLNEMIQERDYLKERLVEIQAEKESAESRASHLEESLERVRSKKVRIKKAVENIGDKENEIRISSEEDRLSGEEGANHQAGSSGAAATSEYEAYSLWSFHTENQCSARPPERPQRHKRRKRNVRVSDAKITQPERTKCRTPLSSQSDPGVFVLEGAGDPAGDDACPRKNRKHVGDSRKKRISLMETKERCKIAIEGHAYARDLVLKKKIGRTFSFKGLFLNPRK